MDSTHQDATFNFDLDFDMPQQQLYTGLKAAGQGNTASGYFDEGIDTTTTGGSIFDQQPFDSIFDPVSTGFDMEQPLTLDNTSGGASWGNVNTTTMTSFPSTPAQSFDAIYNPQFSGSALGKRQLQLDVHDFPQPKRHESVGYSPFTGSAATGSSWAVDTQPTPTSSTDVGLSDEAADVCAMWFSKYNVLPSDRHIDSLSQLTGESPTAIRHWFGQALKQGMTHDSAYKSQTGFTQQLDPILYPGSSGLSETVAQPLFPDIACNHDAQIAVTTTTQGPLRGGRKGCNPTDDPELLKRDPNKIYQCTRKCGKRYGRKCDWKRNEEEGYPSKSWTCALCVSQGDRVKPCFRKYHFSQHFRNIHPGLNCTDYEQQSIVESDTDFPKKCGFCPHRFTERQDRIDHIAEHFKQGKCMLDWIDDDDDSNRDSDNTDDNDDDDRPDSDGFDNSKPFFPPNQDQRGGSSSKFNGNGGNGSGGQHPPQGGYFQFQLAQSTETEATGTLGANTRIRAGSSSSSSDEKQVHERPHTTKGTHSPALAGDVVTQSLDRLYSERDRSLDHGQGGLTTNVDVVKLADIGQISASIAPDPPIEVDLPSERPVVASPLNTIEPVRRSVSPISSQSFLSVKLLGTGGFSTVDEVMHRETSLRISRKTLKNRDHSALEELKKEVDVLQKLRHPHVVRFLGAYSRGDKMSILLSPVAETTLEVWLNKSTLDKPLGLARTIVKMLGCLSSTVRYLHEQRPVVKHMDIKPQNILVMQGDQDFPHVVLSDFGVSTFEETDPNGRSKPLTRQYCAPEVSEGISRDQTADIWSLGCVFAEMATVAFSEGNSNWLEFRREFRGREGKYYWQDVPAVHDWLSQLLEEAKDLTETSVVRTVKSMLSFEPALRPDAAKLTMTFTPAPCCLSWPNDKASYPGPLEESASVEMFVHEDGIDCRTHFHLHGGTEGKQICDSIAHAKSWLDECAHEHGACCQLFSQTKALPTRLVDIRPNGAESTSVRIVDSAELVSDSGQIDYISLGYMWDRDEPILSTDRLQAMQSGLSRELLPRALNEAISTAERIGYRYIWVDSLCVLQDSEADRERECLATAEVYRNSALTIVLDQLKASVYDQANIHEGSSRKDDGIQDPCRTPSATDSSSSVALPAIDFQTPGFGWDTRAWALQERFLSPRHLHLCEQQMYWECNLLKASETFPRGLPPLLWEKVHTKTAPVANVPLPHLNSEHELSTRINAEAMDEKTSRKVRPMNGCLRNQQWIRREGDGIGDPMEAQMQLELRVADGRKRAAAADNAKFKAERSDRDDPLQSLIEKELSECSSRDCIMRSNCHKSLQPPVNGNGSCISCNSREHVASRPDHRMPDSSSGNEVGVGSYIGHEMEELGMNRYAIGNGNGRVVDGSMVMDGMNAEGDGDGDAGIMDAFR